MPISQDSLLSTILTAIGGLGFLMAGMEFGGGLLIGLGVAIIVSALIAMSRKTSMTGGWAGAAIMAPPAMMSYFGLVFIDGQDCTALAPGIFFLYTLFALPFAWISAWMFGNAIALRFPFPLAFPIFLAFIGFAASIISVSFMSCSLGTSFFLLSFMGSYLMAWSGLAFGVRKPS